VGEIGKENHPLEISLDDLNILSKIHTLGFASIGGIEKSHNQFVI
jgi:hypothetical protein